MNSDNSLVISGDCVVEAVDSLQSRKAKPDEQKIISYLTKKYRIKTVDARNLINQALAEGIVVKVNYAESISFRTPEKFGQMLRNHQNHIIPFDGSLLPKTAIKRVLIVMRQLLKSMPGNHRKGITVDDILKELHNTSQLLNYTQSILERLLRYALKQGYINRCETGTYTLTSGCKSLDELDYQTIDDDMKMENDKKEDNTIPDGASLLASQSLASSQKGKKRIATAPVLQRVRPMSKRKKIKKSLGPDFLEPSDLGMQFLRNAFEPKCDICGLNASKALDSYEELLHCNNCNAKAHRKCLEIDNEIGHKSQWRCMNCTTCYLCEQDIEEFLVVCFTCHKGFHTNCVIQLTALTKSKGKWNCGKCSSKQKVISNGVNADKMFNNIEPNQSSTQFDTENESIDVPSKCNAETTENDDYCEFNDNLNIKIESSVQIKPDDHNMSNNKSSSVVSEQHDDIFNETNLVNCDANSNANQTKPINNTDISDLENDISKPENESIQNIGLSLPESPQKWTVDDVESFIRDSGFPEQAKVFRDQEIDGRSLLLLRRMDVLTGLSLKLGPALKIYSHIMRLQGRDQFNY